MKIIDTNLIIEFLFGKTGPVAKVKELEEAGVACTTIINVVEVYQVIERVSRLEGFQHSAEELRKHARELFSKLTVLPLNVEMLGRVDSEIYEKDGYKRMNDYDALIVQIANHFGVKTIVTNRDTFVNMNGLLETENYSLFSLVEMQRRGLARLNKEETKG